MVLVRHFTPSIFSCVTAASGVASAVSLTTIGAVSISGSDGKTDRNGLESHHDTRGNNGNIGNEIGKNNGNIDGTGTTSRQGGTGITSEQASPRASSSSVSSSQHMQLSYDTANPSTSSSMGQKRQQAPAMVEKTSPTELGPTGAENHDSTSGELPTPTIFNLPSIFQSDVFPVLSKFICVSGKSLRLQGSVKDEACLTRFYEANLLSKEYYHLLRSSNTAARKHNSKFIRNSLVKMAMGFQMEVQGAQGGGQREGVGQREGSVLRGGQRGQSVVEDGDRVGDAGGWEILGTGPGTGSTGITGSTGRRMREPVGGSVNQSGGNRGSNNSRVNARSSTTIDNNLSDHNLPRDLAPFSFDRFNQEHEHLHAKGSASTRQRNGDSQFQESERSPLLLPRSQHDEDNGQQDNGQRGGQRGENRQRGEYGQGTTSDGFGRGSPRLIPSSSSVIPRSVIPSSVIPPIAPSAPRLLPERLDLDDIPALEVDLLPAADSRVDPEFYVESRNDEYFQ